MNNQFDEFTRSLAQSVTRRGALKKFGVGVAGMALAWFGLVKQAQAQTTCLGNGNVCSNNSDCCSKNCRWQYLWGSGKARVRVCVP